MGTKTASPAAPRSKKVFLVRAAFNIMFEQDVARRVARPAGRGDDVILELLE